MCNDDEKLKKCGCEHNCECHHEHDDDACGCGSDNCHCGDDCHCHEGDDCGCGHCKDDEKCDCGHDCHCDDCHGESCDCNHEHDCDEDCKCGDNCDCGDDSDDCGCKGHSDEKAIEYLNLARQIQADFENFRRHALEDIKSARLSGQASVIEAFLPCLDTFKEAKKSIADDSVLKGVEMIESSINDALHGLGLEKIDSVGQKYDPHIHNVIAVVNNPDEDDDIIIDEYQAGYKFNDKILRYAKVIVNKKEGN